MTDATQATRTGGAAASAVGVAPPGFRLPAETRLGDVRLQVADLDRSLDYYQDVLGLRVLERHDGDAAGATLAAFGDDAPLIRLQERRGVAPVPPQGLLGLYHFAILLPDRAALGRFVAHLTELGGRAGASDHLVSEALYLRDPDGLGIEVYADRPRSTWCAVDNQIRMATEPLDLPAVVAAAGGERWTGMPTGTRMGHVHLHVGDIEAASRFYHVALGLDRMVWSYPGALFLAAGGYHHHLGLNTWAGPRARPAGEGDARLLEWRIILPSLQAAAARTSLDHAGYDTTPTDEGWHVVDPWGTTLHVAGERTP
jgi:catechol 2,3-dioxygenase